MYPADIRAFCGVPATWVSVVFVGDAATWMVKRNTTIFLQKSTNFHGFRGVFWGECVVFRLFFVAIFLMPILLYRLNAEPLGRLSKVRHSVTA